MAKVDIDNTKTQQSTVAKTQKQNTQSLDPSERFVFTNDNWKWVFIGLGLIVLGFVLMAGGKSADPNVFNEKEIYSPRRIIVAPILVVSGFVVEIYAIVKNYIANK